MTVSTTSAPARRGVRRRTLALGVAVLAAALVPTMAFAHPLGNFTINHYAGIRLTGDGVALDVVIDHAEIPAFQERQRIDADGDGMVSAAESATERAAACTTLAGSLRLEVGGVRQPLVAAAAGLSFPPGAGGLPTMRLVCEYTTAGAGPVAAGTQVRFRDDAYPGRIGWREIVLVSPAGGQGADQDASGVAPQAAGGVAARLTTYPADLLAQPPDVRSLAFVAPAAGVVAEPWSAPDAEPLAANGPLAGPLQDPGANPAIAGAIPGGVGSELSSLIGAGDLSPLAILASLLVALGLGAVHALSPGHGKTIMAAYLIGRRGTTRHAVGLGLIVAISHTIGVLALAAITLLAADILPPERLYPILQVASGSLVVLIGGSLLVTRWREWARSRAAAHAHAHGHESAHGHAHGHGHESAVAPGHDGPSRSETIHYADGTHAHGGGRRHRHLPEASSSLSWRALFALGLSGGLVPSASALILLLGSIATGRVVYGLVLVLGFGAGMAIVLGGVGFLVVRASSLFERLPSTTRLARVSAIAQTATAILVVGLGLTLTGQALTQVR